MRPALKRLLGRPSSIQFLRTLVGTPVGPVPERRSNIGHDKRKERRKYGTSAVAIQEFSDQDNHCEQASTARGGSKTSKHNIKSPAEGFNYLEGSTFDPQQLLQAGDAFLSQEDMISHDERSLRETRERAEQPAAKLDRGLWTGEFLAESQNLTGIPVKLQEPSSELVASETKKYSQRRPDASRNAGHLEAWEKRLSSHKCLEFESSLETPLKNVSSRRLVDTKAYKDDLGLWACLLMYRKRVHGRDGSLMFWNALRRRDLHLPCSTNLGDAFWPTFLDLGFEDPVVLKQVCDHADGMLEKSGNRWHGLYSYVVEHFLTHGDGTAAIQWHKHLFSRHSPGANRFARMCRQVAFKRGDLEALKSIYKETGYRNAYSKIVPVLCAREEYKTALDWHYTFLEQGDLPSTAKLVEPLVHFLAIYYPAQATRLTRSLVNVGASFAPTLPSQLEFDTKISREMMNLVHGKDINVPPKKYSDSLGARWFATTWVSLDTAISTVHALGVREIGPLSLQAIALRDPNAKSITTRINQLRNLGISIGISLYSRAIEHFADPKNRKEESLQGLLKSDQHPDELENGELQEALLATYAQAKDWTRYRRTIEIRSLASRAPQIEAANIILRGLILRKHLPAIFHHLEDMQLQGVPVKTFSTKILLRHILHERNPGKKPRVPFGKRNQGPTNDLETAIIVLKKIMITGSYVPVTQWREILRRLGMLGKFQDLRALCLYLAEWYGPNRPKHGRYRVPLELSTKHLLHPLSILFTPSLQRALVEWGFISALQHEPQPKLHSSHKRLSIMSNDSSTLPDVVAGIKVLKKLSKLGVHVSGPVVRKGILNRLVAYYGPGKSNRRHNRWGQKSMAGRMPEVAEKIDAALGAKYFTSPEINLDARIKKMATRRMNKTMARRLSMRYKRHDRLTLDSELLSAPQQRLRIG